MKGTLYFFLFALLYCSPMAKANEIDLGSMACAQFLKGNKDATKMMLTWIDGYMSALSSNTVMSEEWMMQLATHMTTYCTKHPSKTIVDAINDMPDEDK